MLIENVRKHFFTQKLVKISKKEDSVIVSLDF